MGQLRRIAFGRYGARVHIQENAVCANIEDAGQLMRNNDESRAQGVAQLLDKKLIQQIGTYWVKTGARLIQKKEYAGQEPGALARSPRACSCRRKFPMDSNPQNR